MFRDYLKLHFIILLWGFTAIVGMWMSISPLVVVLYRTIIAMLGMALLIQWHNRQVPANATVLDVPLANAKIQAPDRQVFIKMLLTGGLVALHWFLFFASARISTVSICLVGLASTAFWTSALEPLLVKRSWKWYELFLGVIQVGAMYAISHFEASYWNGLLLGIGSALCASLFTIINGQFTNTHHHYTITYYEMIGAFLGSVVLTIISMCFSTESMLFLPNPLTNIGNWIYLTDTLNLLFLAVVCTIYAFSASVAIMQRISPFAVNLSVNMEPVYGILLAALFFGEWRQMTPEFYGSGAVILVCVLIYPILKRWDEQRLANQSK